jgi:hypothetical protein
MERISNLFHQRATKPKRQSQRGELLEYFHLNVNAERDGKKFKKLPIGAVAWKLQGLSVHDLYYLKSICEDERRRGGSWGKVFWGSIRCNK